MNTNTDKIDEIKKRNTEIGISNLKSAIQNAISPSALKELLEQAKVQGLFKNAAQFGIDVSEIFKEASKRLSELNSSYGYFVNLINLSDEQKLAEAIIAIDKILDKYNQDPNFREFNESYSRAINNNLSEEELEEAKKKYAQYRASLSPAQKEEQLCDAKTLIEKGRIIENRFEKLIEENKKLFKEHAQETKPESKHNIHKKILSNHEELKDHNNRISQKDIAIECFEGRGFYNHFEVLKRKEAREEKIGKSEEIVCILGKKSFDKENSNIPAQQENILNKPDSGKVATTEKIISVSAETEEAKNARLFAEKRASRKARQKKDSTNLIGNIEQATHEEVTLQSLPNNFKQENFRNK